MKINWTVRLKSKSFWLAIIVFGFGLDLGDLGNRLIAVVNAAFAVLAILGIVVDPTTQGISDSTQALTYTEPKSNEEEVDNG